MTNKELLGRILNEVYVDCSQITIEECAYVLEHIAEIFPGIKSSNNFNRVISLKKNYLGIKGVINYFKVKPEENLVHVYSNTARTFFLPTIDNFSRNHLMSKELFWCVFLLSSENCNLDSVINNIKIIRNSKVNENRKNKEQ